MSTITTLGEAATVREMFAEYSTEQAQRDTETGYREMLRTACELLLRHKVDLPADLREFVDQMTRLAPLWVTARPLFEMLEKMEDAGRDVEEDGGNVDNLPLTEAYRLDVEISAILGEIRHSCQAIGRSTRRLQAFEKHNNS